MTDREISVVEWAQKDAMKNEAIKFAEWVRVNTNIIENRWYILQGVQWWQVTESELYELFKKQNP